MLTRLLRSELRKAVATITFVAVWGMLLFPPHLVAEARIAPSGPLAAAPFGPSIADEEARQAELLEALPRLRAHTEGHSFTGGPFRKQTYRATDGEIDDVLSLLEEERVPVSRRDVELSSKHWRPNTSREVRAFEAITLSVILIGALTGALWSLTVYTYKHYVFDEPFTCLGAAKAIVTGMATGALFPLVKILERLDGVLEWGVFKEMVFPIFESLFNIPAFVGNTINTIGDFIALVDALISDLIWASSSLREAAIVVCTAFNSETLWRGDLAGVKTYINNELIPTFSDEWGSTFTDTHEAFNALLEQEAPQSIIDPAAQGSLEILRGGMHASVFLNNETPQWTVRFQPTQPGSYVARLKVFRNGIDYGTLQTRSGAASYPFADVQLSGTFSTADVLSRAGNVPGPHQLRVEVVNITRNWTRWLTKNDGSAATWDIDVRTNRKPSVSLDCVTLLGVASCGMFVIDPDNVRPTSLYLTIDGSDENLTSSLPNSGVNWATGHRVTKNLSLPQGIHTARARVSDSQFTAYSGPTETLRIAALPYPELPPVTLTSVGVKHRYAVRFLDSIGGIPNETIYIHTNRQGQITTTSGVPTFRVTTGSDGWAYFDYKPMETGQHTITIAVRQYELQQTSNSVQPEPAAVPPAPGNAQAFAIASNQVRVTWVDNSTVENGFEIERKTGANGSWSIVGYAGRNVTAFTNIGVSENSSYFYRVRAHNAAGYSPYSNEASVTTCVAPNAIRIDEPHNGEDSVPVNMTLEWYTVEDVGTYDIHFGTTDPPPFHSSVAADPAIPNTQTKSMTNLQAGTIYYWQVKAHATCNPANVSTSPVVSFSTLGAPGTVTLLKPTNGATGQPLGLVFAWEAVTTPGTTLYDLHLGTTNPPPFYANNSWETTRLVTGLAANTTYYWKIVAKAADDQTLTSSSAVWSFTTGSSSSTTVNLTCTKDAGLRGGNFANTNYAGANTSTASQNSYFLGNDKGYGFSAADPAAPLRAVVQFDVSSIPSGSNIIDATLRLPYGGQGVLSAPTQPLAIYFDPLTSSWSEGTITWNNCPGVNTANRVTGSIPISHGSPLSFNLTTLAQGWIAGSIANNGILITLPAWESTWGYVKSFHQREAVPARWNEAATLVVTYGVPCTNPPVAALSSPADGATNQLSTVLLSWNAVAGASNYKLYFGDTSNPPQYGIATTNSFQVSGLDGTKTYWWKVEALADCDPTKTSTSATRSFTTGSCIASPLPTLAAPANAATGVAKNVNLTWNAVAWASSYDVLIGTTSPPQTVAGTVAGTTFPFATTPDTTYFWTVRAIATCNASLTADAPVRSFTTASAPHADAGLPKVTTTGAGVTLGASPSASGGTAPYTYAWSIVSGSGGTLTTPASANPTFSSSTAGDFDCELVVTDANGFGTAPSQVAITVNASGPPPAPTGLAATAQSATLIGVTWNAVAGATQYQVTRAINGGAPQAITTVQSPACSDAAVTASNVYIYRVRAIGPGGTSPDSTPDIATTFVLADDPAVGGQTIVRGLHITQLRTVVNLVRSIAGLGPFTFTDPSLAGVPVRAVHLQELRTALAPARSALGLPAIGYTNGIALAAPVKAIDLNETRNGVR